MLKKMMCLSLIIILVISSIGACSALDFPKFSASNEFVDVDADWELDTKYSFYVMNDPTDEGHFNDIHVLCGDGEIKKVPKSWLYKTIVVNIHIYSPSDVNDYTLTIPYYEGERIILNTQKTGWDWNKARWKTQVQCFVWNNNIRKMYKVVLNSEKINYILGEADSFWM